MEGLRSATPLVFQLVEDAEYWDLIDDFMAQDQSEREALCQRWIRYLMAKGETILSDLARYEVALLTARPDPQALALGGWEEGEARLAGGYRLLHFTYRVVDLASQVESGAYFGHRSATGFCVMNEAEHRPVKEELNLLVGFEPGGEMVLGDVDTQMAKAIEQGDVTRVDDQTLAWLAEIGALVPSEWPI